MSKKNEKLKEELKEEKNELELLKEENETLLKEVNDWKKEYSIQLAEFNNYKKRKDKEFEEYKKYASEDLILKQIGNIEVLEKALESTKVNEEIDSLVKGIEMVLANMKETLVSYGVEEVKSEGKYDPYIHHAISTENVEDKEDEEILSVLQKGYILKGKVIRPSMVIINKK